MHFKLSGFFQGHFRKYLKKDPLELRNIVHASSCILQLNFAHIINKTYNFSFQDLEARRLKRGHVLTELLETERIYVSEMSSILKVSLF